VRSRSSRRHPPIQRSAIAFIRGVATLHSTVRIPASASTASNAAVKFDPRQWPSFGTPQVRFRCAGCDHFRTDVSYLPDLTAYLDDLLRTRERLAAATGLDTWARDQAAPASQEITIIRQLISRIKGDISGLSQDDRARIHEAVAVVRKHRAVSIGMPRLRPAAQSLTSETEGQGS
jgi:hypothetical protein